MANGEPIDPEGSVPGTFQGEYERGGGAELGPGIERTSDFEVEGRLLTDVGGTIGVSVLSTPGMIAMIERNAAILSYEHLPDGKATVGFEVCVKHVAAAAEGARCTAHARLREVADGRKLRFDVEVREGERTIGVGTHERRVIEIGAVKSGVVVTGLPERVRIREVGPRDGFQNEPEVIATADKVRLIGLLANCGLPRLEITSFVRPDVIPQLSDAEEVLEAIDRPDDVAYSVLIPNEKGLARALAHRERFDEINVFLSASESHNQRNVNRSIAESLDGLRRTVAGARAEGLRCEGVISVAFGCPYEGEVAPARVFEIAEGLAEAGCEEVSFGDTTGMANPRQVAQFFGAAKERLGSVELTAHFHNTRGQGLANVLAALEQGIDSYESAFGELGGSPLTPGATGNISTEDLVSMLAEMGIDTGVDLPRLIEASRAVQELLGRPLGAHVLRAGPVDWRR